MDRFASLIALVACGAPNKPPPPTVSNVVEEKPPVGLAAASSIVIEDEWQGLGCSYEFAAKLERRGGVFVGTAKLTGSTPVPARNVSLPVSDVEALQTMLDQAKRSPEPTGSHGGWTDDYPKGATSFTTPQGTVRIFFRDQKRQLLVEQNKKIQALDVTPEQTFDSELSHAFKRYRVFLDEVGLAAMHAQLCP